MMWVRDVASSRADDKRQPKSLLAIRVEQLVKAATCKMELGRWVPPRPLCADERQAGTSAGLGGIDSEGGEKAEVEVSCC